MKGNQVKLGRSKKCGFALALVITALAAIAAAMYLLADGSNTMLFQSDTAYLEASRRNLLASGLAWARSNLPDEGTDVRTVQLDVNDLDIRAATLTVTIMPPQDNQAGVTVKTSCTRARRTVTSTRTYEIPLP